MKTPETPKFTGFWHRTFFRDGVNGTPTAEELGGKDVWEPPARESCRANHSVKAEKKIESVNHGK